ncbi:response regulator transcription factor [Alteribacter keqinensis]|uniref:DNA-binding response regulator n=1 Tax=Alteribacter keqinensis TaxID=2483800 RepID=A0A3M7TSP4_9BACI|nr:response regulator transcription factor [Alteribacter keqinensis]RNA68658.1 DNA-binding response regulator [Alteribacter keqinensis]
MRCIISEEHDLIRFGLTQLLKDLFPVEYILEANEKAEVFALLEKYPFDWLFVNPETLKYGTPGEVIEKAHKKDSEINVVILLGKHGYVDPSFLDRYSILGVIRHDEPLVDLMAALESMKEGRTHYSFFSSSKKGSRRVTPSIYLTQREEEVFSHLIKGFSVAETAESLGVSHKTVENHRHNLRKKLNASSHHELMNEAVKLGYLEYKDR